MTQTWHDLLFAHWPLPPAAVRPLVPAAFALDPFEGEAWLGIVPFHMTNVAPRGVPALPWISAFPELNVRTYVRLHDKPGVYFFSLDASSAVAVTTARTLFNLPYHTATMDVAGVGDVVRYSSVRDADASASLRAHYRPAGAVFMPRAGTLEHFLTERYCLYHVDRSGAPYRLEIHHAPWPLQTAEAELQRNGMAAVNGISLPDIAPILHFAKRQDMVGWLPAAP